MAQQVQAARNALLTSGHYSRSLRGHRGRSEDFIRLGQVHDSEVLSMDLILVLIESFLTADKSTNAIDGSNRKNIINVASENGTFKVRLNEKEVSGRWELRILSDINDGIITSINQHFMVKFYN